MTELTIKEMRDVHGSLESCKFFDWDNMTCFVCNSGCYACDEGSVDVSTC